MDARPDMGPDTYNRSTRWRQMNPAGSTSPIDRALLARLGDSSLATAGIVSTNVFESTQKITIVELKNGPGRLTDTGAIQPNGKSTVEITIPFKTYEARRLAVEVLACLQAWDVIRLAMHRELISGFPPYLLTPPSQLLHYQDGTLVEPANENERRAFLHYRKVNGEDPHSLVILRNFFSQYHKTG